MTKMQQSSSIVIKLLGLPWECMVSDIKSMFAGIEVNEEDIKILGGPDGIAFVIFRSDESARIAMQIKNYFIYGHNIKIMLSSNIEMNDALNNNNNNTTTATTTTTANEATKEDDKKTTESEKAQTNNQGTSCVLSYQQASELIIKNESILMSLQKLIGNHSKVKKATAAKKKLLKSSSDKLEENENKSQNEKSNNASVTSSSFSTSSSTTLSDTNHSSVFGAAAASDASAFNTLTNLISGRCQNFPLINYNTHLINTEQNRNYGEQQQQQPQSPYLLSGFPQSCYDYASLALSQGGYPVYAYGAYGAAAYPCEQYMAAGGIPYVHNDVEMHCTQFATNYEYGYGGGSSNSTGGQTNENFLNAKQQQHCNDVKSAASLTKTEFLQISNLPTSFSYREVASIVSPIAIEVDAIKMVNDENGEKTGKALVQFKSVNEAQEAFNVVNGKGYSVQYCTEFTYAHTVDSFMPTARSNAAAACKEYDYVRISGFPRTWNEYDIERFLKSVNFTKDMKPIQMVSDDNEWMAIVILDSAKELEKTLFYDEKMIGNKRIIMKVINKTEFESLVETEAALSRRKRHQDVLFSTKTTCLRMFNLPVTYTESDVYEMFKQFKCESPLEIELQPGDPPRKAYIRFEDNYACQEAYSLRKEFFDEYSVTLQPISVREFETEILNLRRGYAGLKRARNDLIRADNNELYNANNDNFNNRGEAISNVNNISPYANRRVMGASNPMNNEIMKQRPNPYAFKNERNFMRPRIYNEFSGDDEFFPYESNEMGVMKRKKLSDDLENYRNYPPAPAPALAGAAAAAKNTSAIIYQKCLNRLKTLQFPDELISIARRVIILSNVPYKTEKAELLTLISKYGPDKDKLKLRQGDDGKPTGDALVAVKSEQDAKIAVQNLNGSLFNNRKLFACLMSKVLE